MSTETDKMLWDWADDLLEALNIEDLNEPSLTEMIADYIRPRLAAHDAEVSAKALEKFATHGPFAEGFFGGPTKDMIIGWLNAAAVEYRNPEGNDRD